MPDLTLAEYAEQHPAKRCWMCSLPERADVEAGYASGIGIPTIRAYLTEHCGYPAHVVTDSRVRKHFTNGHARG